MGIRPETRDVEDRTSQVAGQTREVTGPMRSVSRETSQVRPPMRRGIARRLSASQGLALRLALSWAMARVLTAMLLGVSAHDPVVFAATAAVLAAVAVVATLRPAMAAATVDRRATLPARPALRAITSPT
jgi:hypothetical protein